jgi:hypothetical protein
MIAEDIRKVGLLADGLLDYFRVITPIKKTNTLNILIEELLKNHKDRLQEKGVNLIKELKKDLPEIIIPDKQLKFILNSILKYAVTLMPPNETLGFLTQSFVLEEHPPGDTLFRKGEPYVETTVFFTGYQKPVGPFGRRKEIEGILTDDSLDLILRLVRDSVHRNRGVMKIRGDESKARYSISLGFPVERRLVFHDPTERLTLPIEKMVYCQEL